MRDTTGARKVAPNTDIHGKLGVGGDDFHEMIEKYAEKYAVNMEGYLGYFHTDEEPGNIGAWFVNPPYRRVKRIPVTPEMLTSFANTRKWSMAYPLHTLPEKRYDILIGRIISIVALTLIVILLIYKYF